MHTYRNTPKHMRLWFSRFGCVWETHVRRTILHLRTRTHRIHTWTYTWTLHLNVINACRGSSTSNSIHGILTHSRRSFPFRNFNVWADIATYCHLLAERRDLWQFIRLIYSSRWIQSRKNSLFIDFQYCLVFQNTLLATFSLGNF